ncbi:MAG: hypothetical protein K6347_03255 [Campylobacterales bacterium]
MEAMFCQEERYETLTIYFTNKEERIAALDAIEEVGKEFSFQPAVYIKMPTDHAPGEVNLEFVDDYDKEAQPIVEALTSRLALTFIPCHLCQ